MLFRVLHTLYGSLNILPCGLNGQESLYDLEGYFLLLAEQFLFSSIKLDFGHIESNHSFAGKDNLLDRKRRLKVIDGLRIVQRIYGKILLCKTALVKLG